MPLCGARVQLVELIQQVNGLRTRGTYDKP